MKIGPAGKSASDSTILVTKNTGMIGYPTATSNGIALRNLWNPSIGLGGKINVKSNLKLNSASGVFVVYGLDHHLDSLVPHGRWFSDIKAAPSEFPGTYTP